MDLDVRFELQQITYYLEHDRPRDTGANLTAYLDYLYGKLLVEHDYRSDVVKEMQVCRTDSGWVFNSGATHIMTTTQLYAIQELFDHLKQLLEMTPYPGPASSLLQELNTARFVSSHGPLWLGYYDLTGWLSCLNQWMKRHEDPRWKRLDNIRTYDITASGLLMEIRAALTDPVSDAFRMIAEEGFRQERENLEARQQQQAERDLAERQRQTVELMHMPVWGDRSYTPAMAKKRKEPEPPKPPEPKLPNRRSIII